MAKKPKGTRPDNRVQVTLTVGMDDSGKPIRKSFYGRTKTEAKEKRDEYKAKLNQGLVPDDGKITVGEWVDHCLVTYRSNINPHYKKKDAIPYNRIKSSIGRMKVSSVKEVDLQNLLTNYAPGKSQAAIERYYGAIHLVFSKALKNKLIVTDPSDDLLIPNGNPVGTHRALSKEEIDFINANWMRYRAGLWIVIMLYTGLRRGEMIALDWKNIDLTSRNIHVRQVAVLVDNTTYIEDRAKTKAGIRTIPICNALYEALCTIPEDKRSGYVCLSAKGELLTSKGFAKGMSGFNNAMTRIMNNEPVDQRGKRTDIEKNKTSGDDTERKIFSIRAHDLRHTFATALYDADVDIKSAQYFMGHTDIRMTIELYTHISNERATEQREKIVSFLDKWKI